MTKSAMEEGYVFQTQGGSPVSLFSKSIWSSYCANFDYTVPFHQKL